jgi:hypothetical protein
VEDITKWKTTQNQGKHMFSTNSPYDYSDIGPICPGCSKVDEAQDALLDVIHYLYSDEPLDLAQLDQSMAILSESLHLKWIMPKLPTVERRKSEIYKFAIELAQTQKAV